MISGFEDNAQFDFFGHKRDHSLCPHCGKNGNKIDESAIEWASNHVDDYNYVCASCEGEWTIRRYRDRPFEKYPQPPFACIYIPKEVQS